MHRSFELRDDKSAKFWTIQVIGKHYLATFGKIGAPNGQTQVKVFAGHWQAREAARRIIAEKEGKGYREVDASRHPAAPASLVASLTPASTAPPAPEPPAAVPTAPAVNTHRPGPRRIITAQE
jgi:predicted DNA-binding WGR domain protein